MNILLLKDFNNYFNRIVKTCDTLDDYKNNSSASLEFSDVMFNPNDGVVTELIVGNESQKEVYNSNAVPLAWDIHGTPDYCICYEKIGVVKRIHSRWFVLESERTRAGQYRIALKRDILADYYQDIMTSPCFVEKGMINDINNPLLYNNESLTYNQIKKEEHKLSDDTNTGWIVGYIAKNAINSSTIPVSTNISILDGVPADYYDEEDLPFTVNTSGASQVYVYMPDTLTYMIPVAAFGPEGGWGALYGNQGFQFIDRNSSGLSYATLDNVISSGDTAAYIGTASLSDYNPLDKLIEYGYQTFSHGPTSFTIKDSSNNNRLTITPVANNTNINILSKKYLYEGNSNPWSVSDDKTAPYPGIFYIYPSSTYENQLKTTINGYMENDGYGVTVGNIYQTYNNKFVKIGSSYYRMEITSDPDYVRYDIFTASGLSNYPTITSANASNTIVAVHTKSVNTLYGNILSSMQQNNNSNVAFNNTNISGFGVIATSRRLNVILSRITTETLNVTLNNSVQQTYDSSANLFAIPYGSFKFKVTLNGDTYTTQKEECLALARAIGKELANSCYDIQLLPYVPSEIVRDLMSNSDTLNLYDLSSDAYVTATRTHLGTTSTAAFVLFPSSCKGTFDIIKAISPTQSSPNYSNALNYKISNEMEVCRLSSPNFNGIFEFSLAKNNGVSKFNVDYTYKPYMPYIHVNPDFKFMYGEDWDDARGLICGGDYSLSFINDYWETYQNNNKNYKAIFDRQIQNMDVNNQIAKEQLEWQTVAGYFGGGIGGGIGGAVAGAKVGGPWGALAGAVGGAYMGTVGAVIGGELDKEWLERQQTEAKSYAVDMYNYQLGNIQAMPYSLTGVESLNNNNKIFPIVEIYKCTNTEVNNLVNKICYNGMTVMAIGRLYEYADTPDFENAYVQGQLIRIEGITDDFHIADAIYKEVKKGFYIPQGGN